MKTLLDNSNPLHILVVEVVIGVILTITSLIVFLKISSEILQIKVLRFDVVITNFIQSFRSPQMTEIMLFITFLGSFFVFVIISVLMLLYIYSKNKKDVFFYSSILYIGVILNLLLKYLFQRPRPELSMITENTYSFPSGHAMNSFVLFTTFSYFIFRESRNLKLTVFVTIFSIVLIFLIGFSRIYLGVHYPSDVLAGYIAGFFWFVSVILFEKAIILKRLKKTNKK